MICGGICCNVTLAWWYVHVSDLCIRSSPLLPFRAAIHALQSFSSSHTVYRLLSSSCQYTFIHALHWFLRYIHSCACILSLFSCISHKAWSPPDLFFSLTCIKFQISWLESSTKLCRERYTHSCAYILSLFSCVSHEAWSPPDLFFSLTYIKSQTS